MNKKVKGKQEDEFNPNALPKHVPSMKWEETEAALDAIMFQFKVIHDLPKLPDGRKATEYMHEALQGLRDRCREIGIRRHEIVAKK
jgi:hypothetical protein